MFDAMSKKDPDNRLHSEVIMTLRFILNGNMYTAYLGRNDLIQIPLPA